MAFAAGAKGRRHDDNLIQKPPEEREPSHQRRATTVSAEQQRCCVAVKRTSSTWRSSTGKNVARGMPSNEERHFWGSADLPRLVTKLGLSYITHIARRKSSMDFSHKATVRPRPRYAAADIVQDVLPNAFTGPPQFRGDSRMGTWLYSIALNSIRTDLRSRGGHIDLSLEYPCNDGDEIIVLNFPDLVSME